MISPIALLIGWGMDLLIGDPAKLPHPIVWFGRMIAWGERRLNRGGRRMMKGAAMAIVYIIGVFAVVLIGRDIAYGTPPLAPPLIGAGNACGVVFDAVIVFYCLAGTTLIREVRAVFLAVDRSLDEGRRQVARIVGRDTGELSAQEVRTAALETLAENLSDGVIAPLFWLALLGTPGMMAYKMVNTLDSMIGYRTERYREFGCWAARIDDAANYIPARLTAMLMLMVSPLILLASRQMPTDSRLSLMQRLRFVFHNARRHASPNSGWPEAALAAILDCQFGGPHTYFGQLFPKPFIGTNPRPLTTGDMKTAVRVNRAAEILMVALLALAGWGLSALAGS